MRRDRGAMFGLAVLGMWAPLVALGDPPGRSVRDTERDPRVLTRHAVNHQDWTVATVIRLRGERPRRSSDAELAVDGTLQLDALTMFFPIPEGCASSETWSDRISGMLDVGGRTVTGGFRVIDGLQAGARLAAFDAVDILASNLTLRVEVPMTCWETRVDEKRASVVRWPAGGWEPVIEACLKPQTLVESDSAEVRELTARWMKEAPGGADPRNTPPYMLAKYLAGRVVNWYQPTGHSAASTRYRGGITGSVYGANVEGYEALGAAEAARTGRGPVLDQANLLVAVYRAAGLPARLVIGVDQRAMAKQADGGQVGPVAPVVRAWAEFYLPGTKTSEGEWIPVDVSRQREFSSRAPGLGQVWRYFGHNEELDVTVPVSFHWLPPVPCSNMGAPALWGWIPQPELVVGEQSVRVLVKSAARRGDDPKRSTVAPGGAGSSGR